MKFVLNISGISWFLIGVGLLHTVFMFCELLPWSLPVLLRLLAKKRLAAGEEFTSAQQTLVATIVHNAGIYNGIVAGGLFWAAFAGDSATDIARVLLIGAGVAGVFGTTTLKSPLTAVQALVGIIGFFLV
jgi:putative membrane protein